MAISFIDASTPLAVTGPDTTITQTYNLSGSADFIVIAVAKAGNASGSINTSSVTWNGVAATRADGINGSISGVLAGVELWWLAAPGTGSHDAVATFDASYNTASIQVLALAGVKQVSPVDTSGTFKYDFDGSNSSPADATVDTTATAAGCIRIGGRFVLVGQAADYAPDTGVTETGDWQDDALAGAAFTGYNIAAGSGLFSFGCTCSIDVITDAMVVAAFKPSTGADTTLSISPGHLTLSGSDVALQNSLVVTLSISPAHLTLAGATLNLSHSTFGVRPALCRRGSGSMPGSYWKGL